MKLTLEPEGIAVRLRGKMVDVYDFPDGWLEVRWKGRSLPYSTFDKLQRVSHPPSSRTSGLYRIPDGPRQSSQKPGILKNRALQIAEAAKSKSKTPRRDRRRSDMLISASPAPATSEAAE
jgi:hypothetical protein